MTTLLLLSRGARGGPGDLQARAAEAAAVLVDDVQTDSDVDPFTSAGGRQHVASSETTADGKYYLYKALLQVCPAC